MYISLDMTVKRKQCILMCYVFALTNLSKWPLFPSKVATYMSSATYVQYKSSAQSLQQNKLSINFANISSLSIYEVC